MRKCLVCLFIFLSRLGFRTLLLRLFAFLPPRVPTYTLRPRPRQKTISSNAFRNNSQHSQFSGAVSVPNYDSMNLRIYRIGSHISEKDFRPYRSSLNSPIDQIVYNQSQSQNDVSSLNNNNRSQLSQNLQQRKQTNRSDLLYRPRSQFQYPVHDFKMINSKQEAVNINEVEDLSIDCYFIQTSRDQTIPVMLVQPQGLADYVLIYSHPNALDLDMSFNLKINVLAYDYTGYGQSTGSPSDIDAISDIEAVYEFAVRQLGFAWQKIILYGWSIGSGPSVTLAANCRYPVAGLIIHSGLASGLRKFDPTIQRTNYLDIFPNIDLIGYVNCLVYILHGAEDRQIDVNSAIQLSQKVRNLHKFWLVEKGGHNNIQKEQRFFDEYFAKLREFLKDIRIRNQLLTPSQLLILNKAYQWSFQLDHYYCLRMNSKVSSFMTSKSSAHPTLEAAPPSLYDRENSQKIDYELANVIHQEIKESITSSLNIINNDQPPRLNTISNENDSIITRIKELNMEEVLKQNDESQISFST